MEKGIRREVALGFDETLAKVPEALKTEGFGVLTEIDVAATLKAKIGVDFRRYRILGACNPTLAYQALGIDLAVGTMLPCSVAVYEEGDKTVVIAVDPMQTVAAGDERLQALAADVRGRLTRVLERL